MTVSRIHSYIIMMRSLEALNRAMDRMQKTQLKLSTQKNINYLSDDPVGVGMALNYQTNISKNDYYNQGISMGITVLNKMNTELENAERILFEIRDLSLEAAESNITSVERSALALNVNDLLEELITTSNSKSRGKFLFGGTETLSGTQSLAKPFNAQYNAEGTLITGVVQNPRGINWSTGHLTQDSNDVIVRISGGAIFQPNAPKGQSDVFDAVIQLRDAILSNDVSPIQGAIDTLDTATDHIIDYETILGAKVKRFEITQTRIEKIDLDDKELLSSIMDADMTETIMEYNIQQVAYQASLEAASKSLQQSLLDFI